MEGREKSWTEAMRSARQGDVVAYEWLLGDIAKVLRGVVAGRLAKLGLSTAETEDIVQEVLIGLHSRRSSWDDTRPLLPWLYAIVHYKMVDTARRLRREARRNLNLSPHEWETLLAAPQFDIERAMVNVDRHLTELPAGQRDVVLALSVEGISVKAAAERFQQSEGSIRMAWHRALTRISAKAGETFRSIKGEEE